MNTYYAAIVNHPNQKLDPDNNIPLIQIFHSATERNNWVKAYADNPHVRPSTRNRRFVGSASPTASIETRRFPPA